MRHYYIADSLRRCALLVRGLTVCCVFVCVLTTAVAQEAGEPAESRPPLTRLEAQIEFRQLISEENYVAAVPFGERLLELALEEHGPQSAETAQALAALGDVQRRAEMFEDAEISFLNAIEIFRNIEGPFSAMVIEPSIGLGDTYFDDGQYTNAVSAYNEARTIQRRVYGLLSEDQIVVMDRMTRAFQALSMNEEADEQQRNALMLVERIHGSSDIETLEAIYRYGAWLRSVYRFDEEREQYERAIRLIRSEYDKDHVLLVRPYREIGNSFRAQGFESPRGASALNSAMEILENQPNTRPLDLAVAIVDIADWKTAFGPAGSGHEDYLRAWNLLEATPEGRKSRIDMFQSRRARAVLARSMSIRGLAQNPNAPDAADGHVLLEFDVDPYGRTENVKVIESVPPGFKDDSAARSVRQSRFRPRIENGEFVYALRQGYLISFRYMPDDDD
ncbi:MAG: tetratricopeptide repeat protein [Gammaproteobacteria bacterium]|jgi:protein TonB